MIKIDINISYLINNSDEIKIVKTFSCLKDFLLNNNLNRINNWSTYKTYDELLFIENWKKYKIKKSTFIDYITNYIKICPYCWKTPLYKRKKTGNEYYYSFDLDHFLSKKDNPEFIRSLYNLIPVCKACNSIFSKIDKPFLDWKYFHPYFWWLKFENWVWEISSTYIKLDFDDIFDFSKTSYSDISFKKHIFDEDMNKHLKYFNLLEIYKYSSDTLYDYKFFLDKRDIINFRLSNSKNSNSKYKLEKLRLTREYFRSWYPENKSEILKIPNWKMRKDLIERFK